MSDRRSVRVGLWASSVAVAMLALGACGSGEKKGSTGGSGALVGTFRVSAGSCAGGTKTGSFFRMVQINGNPKSGPFVTNSDSPCADKTWTALKPGTDGGLKTGTYQRQPATPFDGTGNGKASAIVTPTKWFAVAFALASNMKDPQTGREAPAPSITANGSTLSGDLRALAAAWNGQHFNQGAPKPDGSLPGNTAAVTGTYDKATGTYTLEWVSTVIGGPFNNFSGIWHLEGVFAAS